MWCISAVLASGSWEPLFGYVCKTTSGLDKLQCVLVSTLGSVTCSLFLSQNTGMFHLHSKTEQRALPQKTVWALFHMSWGPPCVLGTPPSHSAFSTASSGLLPTLHLLINSSPVGPRRMTAAFISLTHHRETGANYGLVTMPSDSCRVPQIATPLSSSVWLAFL